MLAGHGHEPAVTTVVKLQHTQLQLLARLLQHLLAAYGAACALPLADGVAEDADTAPLPADRDVAVVVAKGVVPLLRHER